LHWHSF